MEHCGTPMVMHVQGMSMGYMSMFLVDKLVKSSIVCVSTTLTEALAANVLHRDVSADSITIKDGTAHVICWGYAKLISPPTDSDLRAETAKYWCFDWDKALKPTPAKDQSIGPALYVSSRLLLQAATRGIYDDLESLLYVTLDTLSNRPRAGKPNEQPVGFAFLNTSIAKKGITQARPAKILGSISGYSSKAILGISTNIKMTQFAKPMAPVPKIKEGNSKATASNTRGLGKENVKTVRKPIAISRSSSLDVYKRVSGGKSKTNSQQPAKRAKK
ncbi:hypothetical protein GGH91_002777 [Coemansia sp. RSA 2671]|nr:hypothetical protein GGH91_002777 [Coemansia sp. RSA 2671]